MKPKKGDKIYIPTSLYLSHGSDDFQGGLCTIKAVKGKKGEYFIEVEERLGYEYNYEVLLEQQQELKVAHGKKRGYNDPDEDRPWIEPGDTVFHG